MDRGSEGDGDDAVDNRREKRMFVLEHVGYVCGSWVALELLYTELNKEYDLKHMMVRGAL